MTIDISQLLDERIRLGARKQAHEQADRLEAIIKAELARMGLNEYLTSPFEFLSQVRADYEQKVVRERVSAIVDGLLKVERSAAPVEQSIARLDVHNLD